MNPAPAAAFFDIDQTLVRGASSYHIARNLHRRGFFRSQDLLFAARQALIYAVAGEDESRIHRIVERAAQAIGGHSVSELLAAGSELVDDLYDHHIFSGTLALLEQHRALGHAVWLLSTSPQEVTDLLAAKVGASGSLGTRVERVGDTFTPHLAGPVMHGRHKAEAAQRLALEHGWDLADCWAYSDSKSDIPLLRLVGHPVAINPDLTLRDVAEAERWPIFDFRRAGGLFHRRGTRRSAYLAGGLWLARILAKRLGRGE